MGSKQHAAARSMIWKLEPISKIKIRQSAADKRGYTQIKIQSRPLTGVKSFEFVGVHLRLSAAPNVLETASCII
jgi:hypothetical protein